MNTQYKYLHFVAYKGLGRWDVQNYLWTSPINSAYRLVKLNQLISPQKTIIKKNDYTGSYSIVEKIAFKTGQIVFREENKTGMDLCLSHFNELLVSSINFHQGAVAINTFGDIVASTHYKSYYIDVSKVLPSYLVLVLRSPYFLSNISASRAKGIKNESGYNVIGEYQIPLPSLAEQQALVDAYNHNLQQATELEQQAENGEKEIENNFAEILGIIKYNPQTFDGRNRLLFANYAQISQWGVDFILHGSKETHSTKYPCKSIETLCKISSGGTPNRGRKDYYGGNIPWIKTGELRNEILTDTEEKITKAGLENSSAKLYPKGSLAIAMYGATIGKTAKFGIDATTNQACAVLTRIKEDVVLTDYLWLYLQTQTDNLKAMAYGGAQPNINAGIIATYKIPLPPLDVQAEIVAEVQAQRAKIAERKTTATTLRKDAITQFEQAIFE